MSRLKSQSRQQSTCPEQLEKIVSTLFLKQKSFVYQVKQQEKQGTGDGQNPQRGAGDGNKGSSRCFLDIYNTCLAEGTFLERWKRQRLVLLPKNNKPPDDPPSYRTLCMHDTRGKMLERFIFNRLETAVGHLLANNQYGFRKGRLTLDAINQAIGKGKEAISGARWKRGSKKYCLLEALNVKYAFYSAR